MRTVIRFRSCGDRQWAVRGNAREVENEQGTQRPGTRVFEFSIVVYPDSFFFHLLFNNRVQHFWFTWRASE